jgi:SAM-dependent methyltransferase
VYKFKLYPIFEDRFASAGICKGHYFHQDLYIAKKIFINQPSKHVDIGSRVDGFVAHVASYRTLEVFDIRKLENKTTGIIFKQVDLLNFPNQLVNYCDSISSLHVLEHIGLGRYGDPVDIDGFNKAFENIYKILKVNGIFYFSVPIGTQCVYYNAHRVFDVHFLVNLISTKFDILEFSFVDDNGDFHENVTLCQNNVSINFNCINGCGIFVCKKI